MLFRKNRTIEQAVAVCLAAACCISVCLSLAVWLIPVDVIKVRAFDQAPEESFAQFEAVGKAEAIWWMLRVSSAGATLFFMYTWRRRIAAAGFMSGLIEDVFDLLRRKTSSGKSQKSLPGIVVWVRGTSIVAMLGLACIHQIHGMSKRASDWPYYRLNNGDEILPNISDSNRAVIRYLRTATPEQSRILVVSDQKLFFLSYYLLPRHLLHHMHPDAEHLIPRKNQERQLAAYRLSDLPATLLREQRPDYVLEYFEGPEYVESERATEDADWLRFIRNWQRDPSYVPTYTVVLRRWTEPAQ